VAPNLRGYEHSSAPTDVQAYRAKFLVQDVAALIAQECGAGQPLAALVAHDWGGALAWNLANQHPELLRQLVVINSPHPGPFVRAMQSNPAQQAASAYMNFLVQPDAAAQLSANGFAKLLGFLHGEGDELSGSHSLAARAAPWLTPALEDRYRAVWSLGLDGPLNYYRASPLRPATAQDTSIANITLPAEMLHIAVPTLLLWAQDDIALLPCLTERLEQHIPNLKKVDIEGATHWVVHEQPQRVIAEISAFLKPQ
jgi:pimeloyl-ACP methyl ester carboxylesterase